MAQDAIDFGGVLSAHLNRANLRWRFGIVSRRLPLAGGKREGAPLIIEDAPNRMAPQRITYVAEPRGR